MDVSGVSGSARAALLAQLYEARRIPFLVVLPDSKQAQILLQDLRFFSQRLELPLIYFPPYDLLPYKFISYHNEIAAGRIKALYQLLEASRPPLVVTTVAGVMQRLIPKDELGAFNELLIAGEEIDPAALLQKLTMGGYSRATLVEETGDFCMRGGILDIFCPLYDDPLRIEFFGDMVESLRFFSATTQRTLTQVDDVVILPARETLIKIETLEQTLARIRAQASELTVPVTQVRQVVARIKEEGLFPGIDGLMPLMYTKTDTLIDYFPADAAVVLVEPAQIDVAAHALREKAKEGFDQAREGRRLCVAPEAIYLSAEEMERRLAAGSHIHFRALPVHHRSSTDRMPAACRLDLQDTVEVAQQLKTQLRRETPFEPLIEWIRVQQQAGRITICACHTAAQADRLAALLSNYHIRTAVADGIPSGEHNAGLVYTVVGEVSAGFVWPQRGVALITDNEIFGAGFRHRKTPKSSSRAELLTVAELKRGDIVVHDEHGIGRYVGLIKIKHNGTVNDYIEIRFRDDDKLYLPVERMALIEKYMGVDGAPPPLDKMGGKSWEKVKRKVKRSTEKIAGELLKLYAARRAKKGYSFNEPDSSYGEFVTGFPYEATRDQDKAIENVLADMRAETPMDRLVCGDVGYGKTEVALRAAFLCVSEAKQAAVLVPTTVLAEQHYATFSARFQRDPITVACLSRFRTAREQRDILENLKNGNIDIVVGTHRLLQKDVAFQDLGILILDEEQRFGVKHKEKLKRLRETVDVLTLTATPIPRTLHLSLMGIRDISVIATPPEERMAIRTYVCEYDDQVTADAVRRELQRGGQIFFVHNHVASIQRMADHLQALVPEARLAVAHGQMAEDELEKAMMAFIRKEVDLLVCTTIIESGLDISSANTILINRADRFGLSQIYQLRGRVGRSDEQAFAYLFIPHESTLTQDAQKRLKVLMEHSDLGSGFQIAMSDLKIRGGGTILGASQSGHIAAVGYDMFLKLMEDSVAELKGEPLREELEPEINLPMSAFLAESYINDIDQRLTIYRRLAKLDGLKGIAAIKAELTDRFGPPPEEVENLLLKIMLKVVAARAGVKKLDLLGNRLSLSFSSDHQVRPYGIVDLISSAKGRYRITPDHLFKARLTPQNPRGLLAQTKNILLEIARHVND
ncbi:MAG: transcription-repair coupling factor [Desulfosarcinaceae bacterium]|nr:transcription-repair coupling factor [Desulfosarcinaceae bacterium]